MFIIDFFKIKRECRHDRVPVDVDEAYCPDCGALVQNKWFLVRCSCCHIKRSAHTHYDEVVPDTKFCKNCGASEFEVEELKQLNFTDVRYAVFKKIVINQENISTRQVWVEEEKTREQISEIKTIPVFSNN